MYFYGYFCYFVCISIHLDVLKENYLLVGERGNLLLVNLVNFELYYELVIVKIIQWPHVDKKIHNEYISFTLISIYDLYPTLNTFKFCYKTLFKFHFWKKKTYTS